MFSGGDLLLRDAPGPRLDLDRALALVELELQRADEKNAPKKFVNYFRFSSARYPTGGVITVEGHNIIYRDRRTLLSEKGRVYSNQGTLLSVLKSSTFFVIAPGSGCKLWMMSFAVSSLQWF